MYTKLTNIQEAAVGYRGAEYLAKQTNGYQDYTETAALSNLYGMYVNAYGSYAFNQALRQVDAGQCTGLDAAGAGMQGAVWLAQNTEGYMNHTEESALEDLFNLYARTYGDWALARELQGRLDPEAYEAIRNQPWWKW